MNASGQLKVVPSCNLGALGPSEGAPTVYNWHWYYSAVGLTLWGVLVLAMVVPKANRTRGVLAILVPVLLVHFAWLAFALVLKPSTSDRGQFSLIVLSLAVGTAVLWLFGHWLANHRWFVSLLLAIVMAVGVVFLGMLSFGLDGPTTIQVALMLSIFMFVVVLAHALAGLIGQNHYAPLRLVLSLVAGMVVLSAVGMSLFFIIMCTVAGSWPSHPLTILMRVGGVGMIIGGCIFLISLPFVLVGLRSPLFRPRLFACLRLGPASGTPDSTAAPRQDDAGGFGLTKSHPI